MIKDFNKIITKYIELDKYPEEKLCEVLKNEIKVLRLYFTVENIDFADRLEQLKDYIVWRIIDLKILYVQLTDKSQEHNTVKYNFDGISFPKFDKCSFFLLRNSNNIIIFDREVTFLRAKFKGEVVFINTIFKKKVSFNIAHFYETVIFKSCRFEDVSYFRKTYFDKATDFEASFFENVALDAITFPEKDNIKMVRTSFENVIWSDFINANDVFKIESERETFARLKQANSERGNFIDSNLFFVEESNIYLKNSIRKLFCIHNKENENPNLKCPKWYKKIGFLGDVFSFGIAKYTSKFGTNWFMPLGWFILLFIVGVYVFEPNKDFIATPGTPKFLLLKDDTKKTEEKISNVDLEYYKKNYYDGYNFEFQEDSEYKLKNSFATKSMYVFGSLAPTVISSNQWFSTVTKDRFAFRAVLTILFWYFLGAFMYALKNRTRRV